jgi:2-methylcitrate dehydratase PrpD
VDFSKKIKVIADNGLDGHNAISPNHGIVEVDLKNGETLSMYCQYPLGSEPNGMTEEQRIAKLRYCAEDMTEAEKDQLVNWILTLDEVKAL